MGEGKEVVDMSCLGGMRCFCIKFQRALQPSALRGHVAEFK